MRSPDITVLIMVCGLLQDINIAPSLADQTTASQGTDSDESSSSSRYGSGPVTCDSDVYTAVMGKIPPYSYPELNDLGNPSLTGCVYKALTMAMSHCCGNVTFNITQFTTEQSEVEALLDEENFAFPVVKPGMFLNSFGSAGYTFLPVIETTGSVLMVKAGSGGSSVVGDALIACWPLMIIVLTASCIAGYFMWLLDRGSNNDDFPQSFLHGGWDGVWWAFVTMTTVGYGDRAPKSILARSFGLFWMFCSIILMSIFTATLTTALTADYSAKNTVTMAGSRVGVMKGSIEEILAYKEGATSITYTDLTVLMEAVISGEVEGGLIDINLADHMREDLTEASLTTGQSISNDAAFGIIVQNVGADLEMCVSRAISRSLFEVYRSLMMNTEPGEAVNHGLVASAATSSVLAGTEDASIALSITWFLLTVLCLAYHFLWFRPREQKKVQEVADSDSKQVSPPVSTASIDWSTKSTDKLTCVHT